MNSIAHAPSATRRAFALSMSLLALLYVQRVEAQPPEKKIGFSVQVRTDGFLSTTVAKVLVTEVAPDSQALAAGVAAGDELVKIEETIVPGNSALKLKEPMVFVPGVPKRITFKRPTGALFEVVFVRAAETRRGS